MRGNVESMAETSDRAAERLRSVADKCAGFKQGKAAQKACQNLPLVRDTGNRRRRRRFIGTRRCAGDK